MGESHLSHMEKVLLCRRLFSRTQKGGGIPLAFTDHRTQVRFNPVKLKSRASFSLIESHSIPKGAWGLVQILASA